MRSPIVVAAALSTLLFAAPARADGSPGLAWSRDWPRFRPAEVALTAGLTLNAAAAFLLYPAPKRNWEGGILFDDAVRDGIRLESLDSRTQVAKVSDYIYYGLLAYPMVVDVGVVAFGVHKASDVGFQMLLINLEAYAFTGAIALTGEKLGRARPMTGECDRDRGYDAKCGDNANLNASFLSGHTAIAFAGSGLLCAHHQHLPLYGGGLPDLLACVTGLAAATTAGVFRVMSDNHYASDVLLGAGLGLFGGYVLPSLFHYGFGGRAEARQSFLPRFKVPLGGANLQGAVAPYVGPGGGGLSLVGYLSDTAR